MCIDSLVPPKKEDSETKICMGYGDCIMGQGTVELGYNRVQWLVLNVTIVSSTAIEVRHRGV